MMYSFYGFRCAQDFLQVQGALVVLADCFNWNF